MSTMMPTAPTGTRWFAAPATGDGWIVLYLGPAEWTDAQLGTPDLRDLYTWPTSLPGLCAADAQSVVRMTGSLIARLHERFPQIGAANRLVDAINSGGQIDDPDPPAPPRPTATPETRQFEPGEFVKLGKTGARRTVIKQHGFMVDTTTAAGSKRRAHAAALIRIDHS